MIEHTMLIVWAHGTHRPSKATRTIGAGFTIPYAHKYNPITIMSCCQTLLGNRYIPIRTLGHGAFSTVTLCHDTRCPSLVAVKVPLPRTAANIAREIRTYERLEDPFGIDGKEDAYRYIVRLVDEFEEDDDEDEDGTRLGVEVMGPTVASVLLQKNGSCCCGGGDEVGIEVRRAVAKSLIRGVNALHAAGVVHSDLTLGNMLFGTSQNCSEDADLTALTTDSSAASPLPAELDPAKVTVKLTDLGASFDIGRRPRKVYTKFAYVTPEMALREQAGPELDVWSIGCLLFEIFTGGALFTPLVPGSDGQDGEKVTGREFLDSLIRQQVETLGPLPQTFAGAVQGREKLAKLAEGSEREERNLEGRFRRERSGLLGDEGAEKVLKVIRRCLVLDPTKRASVKELLKLEWAAGL